VTGACKFLLFPRADIAPSDRPRGAGVVDACRSLLIPRSRRFKEVLVSRLAPSPHPARLRFAWASDPPPPGEGKSTGDIVDPCRSLLIARFASERTPTPTPTPLAPSTLPESSIRRERSPRRIGRFWGRVRERAAPVRRSQPRAIVNRCRSLLIARLRRCAAARPATPPDFALRAQSGRRRDRSASAIVPPCKFLFFPAAGAPLIAPARSPHPARPLLKFWAVAFAPGQPGPTATEISRRRNHLPRSGDWHGPCESCSVARSAAHLAAVKRPRPWGPPIQRTGE
jgi:hypothetical protein